MKVKFLLLTISFFSLVSIKAQSKDEAPKLVVGIVVDQMRWDYLYRYMDRYSNGGFKRLLKEGYSNENTYIPYVPTYTAIGHSTVYTGSVPAIHGITGNDFIIQATGESMYCTQDDNVNGVGTESKAGKMSPKNLLTSTVTDQLKLATNFRSRVFGVALKDRGAILPAGHFADAAFWFDGDSGKWISSTFYMNNLPEWVLDFNKQKNAEKYLNQNWETLYPINTYLQSEPNDNTYKKHYKSTTSSKFPYDLKALQKENGLDLIKSTPFGNSITKDFAISLIEKENLGANVNKVPDFIAISFSSTDYVGHQFSTNSIEIEDTYLRLDKDLEELLSYLDKKVGKGKFLVFLTADHGGAHNPKYFQDKKGNGGYFQTSDVRKEINNFLAKKYNSDKLVRSLSNYQVHLNYNEIEKLNINEDILKNEIVKYLEKLDGISFVVNLSDVDKSAVPTSIKQKIINGYNSKRSGAITYVLDPQWYGAALNSGGTTHGTWAPYDSHIPFILMGWKIKHGKNYNHISMADIAPTISALLKIEEPNGNIGKPVVEIFNK